MKVINGTSFKSVTGDIATVRHGEPAPDVMVMSCKDIEPRPCLSWYWGTRIISMMWRYDGRAWKILRVPPEQEVVTAAGNVISARDVVLGDVLAGAGGDAIEILGVRMDMTQTSLANLIFQGPGMAIVDGGLILPV